MRKNLKTILYSLLFLLIIQIDAVGQLNNNVDGDILKESCRERITLVTDRTIYSVGETVKFKAVYNSTPNIDELIWSKVLYVELIKPDGVPMNQVKVPISDEGVWGEVEIPKNLLTGVYYLKAYTKWMRNFTQLDYSFLELKIINLAQSQLVADNTNGEIKTQKNLNSNKLEDIDVIFNQEKFTCGEKVDFELKLTTNTDNYEYSIRVVKKGTWTHTSMNKEIIEIIPNDADERIFYPEINGVTLSGRLIGEVDGYPLTNEMVYLSLLNKKAFYSGFKTNSNGEFYFTLPQISGKHDFFITNQNTDQKLNFLIDNDFCQRPLQVNTGGFSLSETEEKIVTEMCINAQLATKFQDYLNSKDLVQDDSIQQGFYGSATKILYTKRYIDLPNLQEFIFELLPELNIAKSKGELTLKTSGWNSFHNYPMLTMVDNIPVADLSAFLAINANKIERIELVDKAYVLGSLKFNGIINVFTKKRDMAEVDLPYNSLFFSYMIYNDSWSLFDVSNPVRSEVDKLPDRRNCLYWNPDVDLSSSKEKNFSFYTSDIKGDYQIIIHAIRPDTGDSFSYIKDFSVE